MPARNTRIQKSRNCMDTDRPRYRKIDKGLYPLRRVYAFAVRAQGRPPNNDIKDQIAHQYNAVPEHNRVWCGIENNVSYPHRLSHINKYEQDAHNYSGYREELTQDDYLPEFLEIMEIVRNDEHNGRCGDTDQEGELADVESPGHVAAQTGDTQSIAELPQVLENADSDDDKQCAY